jgi:uncharacterized membrane protein
MKQFSIGEALSFGWESWKSNALLWIGVLIVAGIIDSLPQIPSQTMSDRPAVALVAALVGIFLSTLVQIGLTKISLSFVDTGRAEFADLFNGYPVFVSYLIASLIFAVMLALGIILLVVPGIIVAVVFVFYSYVIVDRGMGPIEALQRSMELTRGVRMDLFLFGLASLGLNLLGMIPCFLGLFVTAPMTMMAAAYIYRRLDRETPLAAAG